MLQAPADLAAMAEALSLSPDYRVLRRLIARPAYIPTAGQEVRTGILRDTARDGRRGLKGPRLVLPNGAQQ